MRPSSGRSLNKEVAGAPWALPVQWALAPFWEERNVSGLCVRGQWECPGALSPGAAEEEAGGEKQLLSPSSFVKRLENNPGSPQIPLEGDEL